MTFEVGKRYRDAAGRRWLVTYTVTLLRGDQEVMIVRRWFKHRIAMTEERGDKATIYVPSGWVTIYAEGEE